MTFKLRISSEVGWRLRDFAYEDENFFSLIFNDCKSPTQALAQSSIVPQQTTIGFALKRMTQNFLL